MYYSSGQKVSDLVCHNRYTQLMKDKDTLVFYFLADSSIPFIISDVHD